MNIKLLDCTLRDGGYVNDWEFGQSCIEYIFQRLLKTKADAIEVGFIDDRRVYDSNRTIFPDTESINKTYKHFNHEGTLLFAMIDYGTCDIKNIQPCEESCLDGIRVIFKINNMKNAVEYGRLLKNKGYLVSLQLVSVTSYTDKDILDFCELVNDLSPYSIGIVDTYGLMHKEKASHYFELLDHNLNADIAIGYHSHNNFQLAYANTLEILSMKTDRLIIADGTLYGMGKSAGNAPTELLIMHLNEIMGQKYDVNQALDAIDACVIPIYEKKRWGYNLLFYLAASNDCHPNYIEYLLSKKTLSVSAVKEIASRICDEKKLKYDEAYIEGIYLDYQQINVDDTKTISMITEEYANKDILLLAPGKSVENEAKTIRKYIDDKRPIVVAVNFIPNQFKVDAVFIGNSKRYSSLTYQLSNLGEEVDVIITSNISSDEEKNAHIISISRVLDEKEHIKDISTAMIINLLTAIGVNSIAFAGFDGYNDKMEDSYCGECLQMSPDMIYLQNVNAEMKQKIKELRNKENIIFLTKSKYDEQ